MGTSKLTLMIPLPVSAPNGHADEWIVSQAVSVVPATSENDAAGLAVFMPLKPERATGYYRHMLQMLKTAETKAKRG